MESSEVFGICDANSDGVQWDRLSWRIKKYSRGGDFTIIRSFENSAEVERQLRFLLKQSGEKWIKYDFKPAGWIE